MSEQNTEYIGTTDYKKLERKIKDLVSAMGEAAEKNTISRNLRYVEVDVEGERARGKLQPDELYIPQHIIDTNIRREQSSYVQYIAQSPRAVVLRDKEDPTLDTTILEKDVTAKIRFNGWQLSMFACIDGFQQNGYGIMELVLEQSQPGELAHEYVTFGDFGFTVDTKNIQEAELVSRNYYFTRSRLLEMTSDESWEFSKEQVDRIIEQAPNADNSVVSSNKDKSLYKVQKVMFRIKGVVQVAWAKPDTCDDWIRAPRPLYIGRRQAKKMPTPEEMTASQQSGLPLTEEQYETKYPYFIFSYLISENSTISESKGRAFLDQDCQQAVISLLSSYVTAHRRASGLYFSKNVDDPNDDILLQKNIFFKSGTLINSKVSQMQLSAPPADVINAINAIVTANQQETSQVNFAAQNRKDSRKTAKEISSSENQEQKLTTVQVVLFSIATQSLVSTMFEIIRSRVLAGLLTVPPLLKQYYSRNYFVKPSGDTDVIERQQLIQTMLMSWPVVQNTPAAMLFLCDLLALLFPEQAPRYVKILQEAQAQQQSAQAQQQQQMMGKAIEMGKKVVALSKKPEYFSDIGRIHALPALEQGAAEIEGALGGGQ